MPPVRLPSRDTLTAPARVAPLLRAAQDLAAWAGKHRPVTTAGDLTTVDAADAVTTLDLSLDEVHAAWAIATGTGMVAVDGDQARPGDRFGVLGDGTPDEALNLWCSALTTVLGLENLDGLTTALYTAARPVRLDALFEAYAAAGGALTHDPPDDGEPAADAAAGPEPGLEPGLELLADLGAVELGADEDEDDETGLTVTLSPIGLWAIRDRLAERGWRGGGGRGGRGRRRRGAGRAGRLRRRGRRGRDRGLAGPAAPGARGRGADRGGQPGLTGPARGRVRGHGPGRRGRGTRGPGGPGQSGAAPARGGVAARARRAGPAQPGRQRLAAGRPGGRVAGGGRARGRGGRAAARPAAARPGRAGRGPVAGGGPGRHRAADHAQRPPSRARRGQGGAQGRVQGTVKVLAPLSP